MFDAHCHLDLPAFDGDRDAVLARARSAGVRRFMVAGVDPDGWARQRALVATRPEVAIGLGLHPWTAARAADPSEIAPLIEQLEGELDRGGVVALGELGLDRGRPSLKQAMPQQREAFRLQLATARRRDLPVVLHVVRAHGEVLEMLEADGLPACGGMVHAFSGSPEVAARYVRLGLHISFCGSVCDPRAKKVRAAAAAVPENRLLVETDAPDQHPSTLDATRNEPAFLPVVIAEVARLRRAEAGHLKIVTMDNAHRLFGSR